MNRNVASKRTIGLALTTAMAGTLLSGCATHAAPAATVSANLAQEALAHGKSDKAVSHAEAAVLAEPRNAAYRATLASAYLDAGRFDSAATTFADAMELGDASPRTVLGRGLALMGAGKHDEAAALLNAHENDIAPADLGLALAIAGQQDRGILLMSNAIRGGQNTPKIRQNLAYAYALAGRWREARLMAAQDVPADKLGDRMTEWAMMAQPEAWQQRVAALLDVPAGIRDRGQPLQLALANNPGVEQLAAEAAPEPAQEARPLAVHSGELPPVAAVEPVRAPVERASFQAAFAESPALAPAPAPVQVAPRAATQPAARTTPVRAVAAPRTATASRTEGTHLVQLGSFLTEQGARRAWGIYTRKYPELAGHRVAITEAVVKGRRYWRVSAAGYGKSSAAAMCGRVRASGSTCFAYAESRPLPGAVDTGTRLASR